MDTVSLPTVLLDSSAARTDDGANVLIKSRNHQGHEGHSESYHRALLGRLLQDSAQPDRSNRGCKSNCSFSHGKADCPAGSYRLVVTEKIVLGRWRRSVENVKRQISKRGYCRNSEGF